MGIFSEDLASVAHLDVHPTGDQEVTVLPPLGQQHSFVEIDYEIFSTVNLSLLLIQEGPLSVSVFINDIFYFILKSDLHNYADDNTLSYVHKDLEIVKSVLEEESIILIKWFEENYMQANPDKFQAICIGKKASEEIVSFEIVGNSIKCESNVTL